MNSELARHAAAGEGRLLSFTNALDQVFLVSTVFMGAAFIAMFFLPSISLRRSHRPMLEEMGVELEEEFGQADALRA